MRRKSRQFTFRLVRVLLLQAIITPMALLHAEEVLEPDHSVISWDCRWVNTASTAPTAYCRLSE
ncbi:hypothetical protein [Spongorhabdus nitratireducens]